MIKKFSASKIVYFGLVFIFIYISWSYSIHELAHLYTCELLGYTGNINITMNQVPTTVCPEINENSINVFFYKMMPYILDAIIFFVIFWLIIIRKYIIKDSFIRILPYVIALDIIVNYFMALSGEGDFLILPYMLKDNIIFTIIPIILVFAVFFGIVLIGKNDKKMFEEKHN